MSDYPHSEPPYSKSMLTRALTAVGLPTTRAYELALRVEQNLATQGDSALDPGHLEELARSVLGEDQGAAAVRKLRLYREFQRLDLPIVVMIGGGTGSGKSSVATEVAHRLGITRVTSTDVIRHTMRAFFSEGFMPTIHHSSFEAGRAHWREEEDESPVLAGFLDQTRNVLVGMGAVIERALSERWSIVLEGVHLVPGLLPPIEGALAVHCVLQIENREAHAAHFWIRDATSEGLRPVQRYLDALDDIRLIQQAIVARARRCEVPVIENTNIEQTITSVMDLVLSSVEARQGVAARG
jgi:2-phosphoglycerate kinase